jgi:hypothetical protein
MVKSCFYRFTKKIYQNYVILFYKSKNKTKFTSFGIDKYIVSYIRDINNIYYLKEYIKYFKDNKISYVIIKEGNILVKEKFDNFIYLDYCYKSMIYIILNNMRL